jgi:hypothetical protein
MNYRTLFRLCIAVDVFGCAEVSPASHTLFPTPLSLPPHAEAAAAAAMQGPREA